MKKLLQVISNHFVGLVCLVLIGLVMFQEPMKGLKLLAAGGFLFVILILMGLVSSAKLRRPGEHWREWLARLAVEAEVDSRLPRDSGWYVQLSCGHRALLHVATQPLVNSQVWCAGHRFLGPARLVVVTKTGAAPWLPVAGSKPNENTTFNCRLDVR